MAMKVWRQLYGQKKADLCNYQSPGVDDFEVYKINFNPYKNV
jgi:hypothetical protein